MIGAIDEGTSSARFMIFRTESTEVICSHQQTFTQIHPSDGYHEHDPMEILSTVQSCMNIAVEKLIALGGDPKDIAAIGVTNQRETTIVWDRKTGAPLYNAIVWCDNRTKTTVSKLLEKVPDKQNSQNYLKPKCGLPLSTYFSAVKLRWLLDNSPEVIDAVNNGKDAMFGTVDSWLIWNLTGNEINCC